MIVCVWLDYVDAEFGMIMMGPHLTFFWTMVYWFQIVAFIEPWDIQKLCKNLSPYRNKGINACICHICVAWCSVLTLNVFPCSLMLNILVKWCTLIDWVACTASVVLMTCYKEFLPHRQHTMYYQASNAWGFTVTTWIRALHAHSPSIPHR